jgi:hypothetical protein
MVRASGWYTAPTEGALVDRMQEPARASSRIQAGSIPRRATHSHHLWASSVLGGAARSHDRLRGH